MRGSRYIREIESKLENIKKNTDVSFKIDDDKFNKICECCEVISIIEQRFNAIIFAKQNGRKCPEKNVEIEINEDLSGLKITLICVGFEVSTSDDEDYLRDKDFYKLIGNSREVKIEKFDEEMLKIEFDIELALNVSMNVERC